MKELKVRQATDDGTALSRMYEIHYSGGGETPDELKGYYTSYIAGDAAIAKWKIANADRLKAKETKEKDMIDISKRIAAFQEEDKKKAATKQAKRKATIAAKKKAK